MTLKVWSLLELMQYFNVCHLLRLVQQIEDRCHRFQRLVEAKQYLLESGELKDADPSWHSDFIDEEKLEEFRPTIALLKSKCEEAELEKALHRINVRLFQKMRDGLTFADMVSQINELRHDIDSDLEFRRFVCIPSEKAKRLDGLAGEWELVWAKVPCEDDARNAMQSYALGLNTGAVFYAMRVAETGLRYLADSIGVVITDKDEEIPIEFGTWDKVITGVRNKITEIKQNMPTNEARDREIQHYMDALDHCLYFKDRYRNPVSHTRSTV